MTEIYDFNDTALKEAIFERTALLLGEEGLTKLQAKKVAVLGLGGVGSFVCEALARTGIGELLLVDNDNYQYSNLNRQLNSTLTNVKQSKCKVLQAHLSQAAPFCQVKTLETFISSDSDLSFLAAYDYVADCIDTISAKIALASWAYASQSKLISAMGTARKFDPSRITITDIFKTQNDRICKVMRYELRKRQVKHLTVAYSDEKPIEPELKSTIIDGKYTKAPLPSMIFVPATTGLRIAHYIISELLK